MDSISIIVELNKIQSIHSCLNEENPITYIVFQEQFRDKLSQQQHELLNARIDQLYNKESSKVQEFISTRDFSLMLAPLCEKYEEHGKTIVYDAQDV